MSDIPRLAAAQPAHDQGRARHRRRARRLGLARRVGAAGGDVDLVGLAAEKILQFAEEALPRSGDRGLFQLGENVAHVFNAWTRMPALAEQVAISDTFTADFTVCRALLQKVADTSRL